MRVKVIYKREGMAIVGYVDGVEALRYRFPDLEETLKVWTRLKADIDLDKQRRAVN